MREVNENEALIRRFLLGELDEDERRRIEERFIADGGYRESVLIAEDDLIEDYLEGSLSAGERERFLSHYLSTSQQRRKLRIAKSIRKYAAVDSAPASAPPDGGAPQHGAGQRGRANRLSLRNPLVSLPLAAALVAVISLGAVKLIENWRFNTQQEQEQAQRSADEQELARVNDRSLPGEQRAGGAALSVTVPPISTRGIGAVKFSPPPEAAPVELLLVLEGDEYQGYEADLQKPGSPVWRTVRRLRAENTPAGKAVRLIIPARLLTRGDYRLRLRGLTPAGDSEEVGEYTFQVSGR